MIHIITIHWRNPFWVGPQLQFLRRHLDRPFRIYSFINGFDPAPFVDDFYFISSYAIQSHPQKLNILAEVACLGCSGPDDWLIFIDSDAFPIADLGGYIEQKLRRYPLTAVRRDENFGDPQPHPCFCATTVGFWKTIGGDWNPGFTWMTSKGPVTDVGANLLGRLRERKIEWFPMTRSNRINLHPVFFGIYDNHVYHHGAGSRDRVTRADEAANAGMARSALSEMNSPLFVEVEADIQSNSEFYRRFV